MDGKGPSVLMLFIVENNEKQGMKGILRNIMTNVA